MTLEQFEDWFNGYPSEYLGPDSKRLPPFAGEQMMLLMRYLESQGFYNSARLLKHEIRDMINSIDLQEDQDFAKLKYSDILNYELG